MSSIKQCHQQCHQRTSEYRCGSGGGGMGEFSPPFFWAPFFFFLSLKYLNNIWFLLWHYKNSRPISKSRIHSWNIFNFQNCAQCEKDLKDNKDNSRQLGRKYVRIFVLGHYLFLEAHSFPQALLSENCSLLGTDNVRGQMSVHIFVPNGDYCLYSIGR